MPLINILTQNIFLDMTGGNGNMDVTQSVTGLVARMDGVTMENSGTFWNGSDGEVIPW